MPNCDWAEESHVDKALKARDEVIAEAASRTLYKNVNKNVNTVKPQLMTIFE